MVTSAIDGEGKTTLAVNLALSLAVLGVRTVLVEGDLRNPEMTRSLCPRARTGLINAAFGEIALHQALLVEPSTKLAVLPSPPPQDAALLTEFVSSEGMTTVLEGPAAAFRRRHRRLARRCCRWWTAARWPSTPTASFWRWAGTGRRRTCSSAPSICSAPVYDRILGAVLTRVDLSRLRFYEAYNGAAYDSAYLYELRAKEAAE